MLVWGVGGEFPVFVTLLILYFLNVEDYVP